MMMWELGNFWTERINSTAPMASIHTMMHEIHVLLVDHDADALNIAKQLEMWQYKVSCAELPSPAISMLANAKFDVVMANISSPDPHGFKILMQHALNMCIPVVWMTDDDNAFMAMRALENGAFLCIKKPPPMEFLRCLWQHVVREKTRMIRERDILVASNNLGSVRGVEFREVVHQRNENANLNLNPNPNPNPHMMVKNKGKYRSISRGRYGNYDEEYDSDNNMMSQNCNVRRKMCTEWTQELHAKFMDAVEQLGEGRCFPKEILELMNEPGLTRMQVASHLQKCRNDNWRSPEERKPTLQSSEQSFPNGNKAQPRPRRFGSMPLVNIKPPSSSQMQTKAEEMGQSSEARWEIETPCDEAKLGNDSNMTNNGSRHYGINSSSNPRHTPDEYFNFPDMDSLINDFSGRQQQPDINHSSPTTYQPDPSYNHIDKNSGEASMKAKSQ